jgi:hypothetical protein
MKSKLKHIYLLGLLLLISGCAASGKLSQNPNAAKYPTDNSSSKIDWHRAQALENALVALNNGSAQAEARKLAETALQTSAFLAEEYELVRPAVVHNLFVQAGWRDRGLCYHWTEDLMSHLAALQLKNYQLRWGVAHRGSDLREHNTVVVTANGQPFEDGLILDPWRDSGKLHWVVVKDDSYPWEELPREEW